MDISSLTALTPKTNKYIPIVPTPKQTAALLMNKQKDLLYGGAAGGGKSIFLLSAALRLVMWIVLYKEVESEDGYK